jgi:hypothetical protein
MQKKGTLVHCWWECKLVQPLWNIIWRLIKKLNINRKRKGNLELECG